MYNIAFAKEAIDEFEALPNSTKGVLIQYILDLQNGCFRGDKALKGKYKGKFLKFAKGYRLIYFKEALFIVITTVRIAHNDKLTNEQINWEI